MLTALSSIVSKGARVTWWVYGIAFFVGKAYEDISRRAMLTWLAWKRVHDPGLWQTGMYLRALCP